MSEPKNSPGEKIVKDIKRAMGRHHSAEEKIRIVQDGLRTEDRIAGFGVARGDNSAFITSDPKTSWKMRRSGWLAIQRMPPIKTKSWNFVGRHRASGGYRGTDA